MVTKNLEKLASLVSQKDKELAKTIVSNIENDLKLRRITITDEQMTIPLLENALGLDVTEIIDTFGEETVYSWVFPKGSVSLSDWLIQGRLLIKDYVTIDLEASHRLAIDLIIVESLRYMHAGPKLKLRVGKKFTYKTDHVLEDKMVTLTAQPDYDIGYNDEDASRLFVVEAKKKKLLGFDDDEVFQLIALLGIVHSTRKDCQKPNAAVYGALASAFNWQFYMITDDGKVKRSGPLQANTCRQIERILFIISYISELIVAQTPSLSLFDGLPRVSDLNGPNELEVVTQKAKQLNID